jgi:hypothetical protein
LPGNANDFDGSFFLAAVVSTAICFSFFLLTANSHLSEGQMVFWVSDDRAAALHFPLFRFDWQSLPTCGCEIF